MVWYIFFSTIQYFNTCSHCIFFVSDKIYMISNKGFFVEKNNPNSFTILKLAIITVLFNSSPECLATLLILTWYLLISLFSRLSTQNPYPLVLPSWSTVLWHQILVLFFFCIREICSNLSFFLTLDYFTKHNIKLHLFSNKQQVVRIVRAT